MRNNNNNNNNTGNTPQRKTDNTFTIVKESYSQNLISTIINAAKKNFLITIVYYSNEKGLTERVIEPMGVVIRMGKKNLVGWCQLRNDWRTFRIDRVNFIKIHLGETFKVRDDYKRENFEDEGVQFTAPTYEDRPNNNAPTTMNNRPNKEFAFNTDNIKTMSENKLDFSNDNVKTYSEDEDDLAL